MKDKGQRRKGGAFPHCAAAEPLNQFGASRHRWQLPTYLIMQ